jgi:hypothetical protein
MADKNYFLDEGLSVKDWCNKLVDNGYELSLVWEGGGDSGWVHFEIDEVEEDNPYTRALVDYCYDHLEYGSFAGEFSTTGTITYNKSNEAFTGSDSYSEDQTMDWLCNIEIKIPKIIWFDRLVLDIQDYNSKVYFEVANGFLTDNHQLLQKSIAENLQVEVDKEVDAFSEEYNFINLSQDLIVPRSEFKETENGFLVYNLENLGMYASEGEDKDVYMELTDELETLFIEQQTKSNDK